jgi:hypothetical protein
MLYYPLPITHYPLPITHYPLPITHYPLPAIKKKVRDGHCVAGRSAAIAHPREKEKDLLMEKINRFQRASGEPSSIASDNQTN